MPVMLTSILAAPLAGLTLTTFGAWTVMVVDPLIGPVDAETVAIPAVAPYAMPAVPAALATDTAVGFELDQTADCNVCVLPSAKMPIAERS